ncbi:E3 ubiquitin-protein ligase listerin isoform X2 [Bombyx mori]|uniref:E3 ubiquitin-protein ligase listerin isoform X2 n=1 Tax=Bombyx mori TaxID=7091 RepID=UPI002ECFC11D
MMQPSSSGRSAELLSNVKLESGLVSIAGGKVLPALFPTLTVATIDQEISPEFQICIKKLNKKDPITKTKGLQEMLETINNSKVDDVITILPSWAHFYKILAIDPDRKVREYTQLCHSSVVRACGRRLAPRLRQLVPAWLQARHDEHGPAQAHARTSLASTFPDAKLPEVLAFCKTEVMTHFLDNLIGTGEASISKKADSPEDKEQQVTRLISSSLLGLEYFVRQLPAQHDAWLWAQLSALLHAAAFWKLAAHSSPRIRAGWAGAVGRLVQRFHSTFGDQFGAKTFRVLLERTQDTELLVVAPLWTCLLLYTHSVQDWCEHLENKELLLKRMLELLENGGRGDAGLLRAVLLPLLPRLPRDLLTKHFYEQFFDAIFVGLEKKNILSSKSERQSWLSGLAEALRHLARQDDDFVLEVVTSVHRAWLRRVLAPRSDQRLMHELIKCSASNMAACVKFWHQQSEDKYDQLIRNFWQNVNFTLLSQIETLSDNTSDTASATAGHVLLVQTLKTSLLNEPKKQRSIKFEMDRDEIAPEPATPEWSPAPDPAAALRFRRDLDDAVQRLVARYFELVGGSSHCEAVLAALATLLQEWEGGVRAAGAAALYRALLRPRLPASRAALLLAFRLLPHMDAPERDRVFDSFDQLTGDCEEWCIEYSAAAAWCSTSAARFLRSPARTPALLRAPHLLTACLAHEILISKEAVSEIIDVINKTLADPDSPELELRSRMGAQLATTLPQDYHDQNFSRLLVNLFHLNVLVPLGDGRLSADTWHEVRSSWQDGIGALVPAARKIIYKEINDYIIDTLFTEIRPLEAGRVESITSLCPLVLSKDASPPELRDVTEFSRALLGGAGGAARTCAVRHDCIQGNFNCPFRDDPHMKTIIDEADGEATEPDESDLTVYVNKCVFRSLYLKAILLRETEDESGDAQRWGSLLLRDDYFLLEFCQLLHDHMVLCTLDEAYAFSPLHEIVGAARRTTDAVVLSTVRGTERPARRRVLAGLAQRAAACGYYWAKARRYFELNVDPDDLEAENPFDTSNLDLEKMAEIVTGNGYFHSLQASLRGREGAAGEGAEVAGEGAGAEGAGAAGEGAEGWARVLYLVMVRSVYAAHGDEPGVLDARFLQELARCDSGCRLDVIIDLYYRHNHVMLYDRDIRSASWAHVLSNAAVCECLRAQLVGRGRAASAAVWDFLCITLCSLLSSLQLSKAHWGSTKYALLARAVLRLYVAAARAVDAAGGVVGDRAGGVVGDTAGGVTGDEVAEAGAGAARAAEWRDVFAPDLHANLFALLTHVLDSHHAPVKSTHVSTVEELMLCTKHMDWNLLPKEQQVNTFALSRLVRACCGGLAGPHRAHQHLAACVLELLVEPLVLEDVGKLSMWSESSDEEKEQHERPQLSLEYFHEDFVQLTDAVEAALAPYTVGEAVCGAAGMSARERGACLGWLLMADSLHRQCRVAKGDLKHYYIHIYKDKEYGVPLLEGSLRLLPEELLAHALGNKPLPPQYAAHFHGTAPRSLRRPPADELARLACACVRAAVCGAGCGAARAWRSAAPQRAARLFDAVLAAYVTPLAVRDQLLAVHERANEIENAQIQVLWSSQEVSCVYRVEGRGVELRVQLARDHPVGAPRVTPPPPGSPGANTHWISVYLAYQDGTVLSALRQWTRAAGSRVQRAAVCYICYCRLQPAAGTLPRAACRQCKNKFHKECLRKWFSTSNKSNCPLCRASF